MKIPESDKVEILTLQDDYVDPVSMDGNEAVQRAVRIYLRYIDPMHGRIAIVSMEREMPDLFHLNLSGTRMVFSA